MTARVLTCSQCGGPVTFGAMFCGYCRAPLTWSHEHPHLQRGALRVAHDFAAAPPPSPISAPTFSQIAGGAAFQLEAKQMYSGYLPTVARNGTAMIEGQTRSTSGGFGVLVRMSRIVKARLAYALTLRPATRSVQLSRIIWATTAEHRPLFPWRTHPAVRPPGEPNALELRFADSLLQIVVNDESIASLEDASFGVGQVGWRVVSFGEPCQVQLSKLAVHALG